MKGRNLAERRYCQFFLVFPCGLHETVVANGRGQTVIISRASSLRSNARVYFDFGEKLTVLTVFCRCSIIIAHSTNMPSLDPSTIRIYDVLWKAVNQEPETTSFLARCRTLLGFTRLRCPVIKNFPPGMTTWPGWKTVQEVYSEHLCDLDGLFEYIFRRVLKALFGKEGTVLYKWFIRRQAPEMTITKIAIDAVSRVKTGIVERRAYQALLHASFTRHQLEKLMGKHENLLGEFDGDDEETAETRAQSGSEQQREETRTEGTIGCASTGRKSAGDSELPSVKQLQSKNVASKSSGRTDNIAKTPVSNGDGAVRCNEGRSGGGENSLVINCGSWNLDDEVIAGLLRPGATEAKGDDLFTDMHETNCATAVHGGAGDRYSPEEEALAEHVNSETELDETVSASQVAVAGNTEAKEGTSTGLGKEAVDDVRKVRGCGNQKKKKP